MMLRPGPDSASPSSLDGDGGYCGTRSRRRTHVKLDSLQRKHNNFRRLPYGTKIAPSHLLSGLCLT